MNKLSTLDKKVINPIWTIYQPYIYKLSTLYEQVIHPR